MLNYQSIHRLCQAAQEAGLSLSQLVLEDQALQSGDSAQTLLDRMDGRLEVMLRAVEAGGDPNLRSTSGLTGGDGARMMTYAAQGGMTGPFLCTAIAKAIAVAEYNAAMGKIVAAPTAGSCGILPAALLTLMEAKQLPRQTAVMGLFTAGAIGMVIGEMASVSGATGGCQAECGSAAAMAAAALVEMMGGTPLQSAHACAMAIKNQLGLVCDPVAGLVEIPCIKRNVAGVVIAFSSAEMALAGIESHIPVDEVVDAMARVGSAIPCSLRETAQGGLATTPTGLRLQQQVFGG